MSAINAIATVLPEEWSECAFKKLHLEGCCSPNWIRNLLDKWISGEIKARVFADQWPNCTCIVILYQEWLPHRDVINNNVELIATAAGEQNSEKIIDILGRVIDWSKSNLLVHGYTDDMAKMISNAVYHPLGREHGCIYEGCLIKRYSLTIKEQKSQQQLSDEFYYQQLEPCHAEYIARYWGYWSDLPSIRTARFLHCINSGDSVGVFTKTTPTKLVSWAVKDASGGFIHHLYTLEEYRGRGLASAVVREMCNNKEEVPFTYIAVGNKSSVRLFEKIGFKEDPGLYRIFLNYLK